MVIVRFVLSITQRLNEPKVVVTLHYV